MRALLSIPLRKYKEPEENSNKLSPPHLPATGPHVHHLICYYEWTRSQWRPISPPIALRPIISPQILSLKLCFPLSWIIVSIWTCYLKNILTVYISNVLLIPHSSIYLLARAVSWKSCLYWLSSVLVLFPFIFSYSTPIKFPSPIYQNCFWQGHYPLLNHMVIVQSLSYLAQSAAFATVHYSFQEILSSAVF